MASAWPKTGAVFPQAAFAAPRDSLGTGKIAAQLERYCEWATGLFPQHPTRLPAALVRGRPGSAAGSPTSPAILPVDEAPQPPNSARHSNQLGHLLGDAGQFAALLQVVLGPPDQFLVFRTTDVDGPQHPPAIYPIKEAHARQRAGSGPAW